MPANNHELKNVQTDQRLKSNPGVESTPKLAHSPDNQNTLQRARSQSTGVVSSSAANPEEQLTPHQRFNIEFKDDLQVINIMKTLVTYAQSRKKTNVLNAKLTNLLEARDRQKQNPEDPNLIFSVLEAMEDIFVLHVSLRSETDSKKMREDIDFIKNQVSRVLKMYGYDKLRFSSIEESFYKLLLATSPTDKSVSSQIRGIGRELELLEDSLLKKKSQEQQAEAKEPSCNHVTPHERFNAVFKNDSQVINIMKTLVTYAQSRKKTKVLNAKLINLLEARDRQKQNPEDSNLIFSVLEAMEDIFVLHVSLRSKTDSKKMREDIDFIKNQVSRVLKMYGYDKLRFSSIEESFYKLLLATSPTDKSVSSQIRGIGRELELLEDSLVKKKTQEQQAEAKSYLSKFNVQFNTLQEQIRNSSVNDEKIKLNQRIAKYIEDIDDKVGLANQGDPILALIKLDLKVLQESAKTLLRQLNTEIGQQTAKNIAAEELKSLKSLTEPSKEEDTLLGQLNHFIAGGDALMDEDTKIRDYIEEISIRIENTSDFTVKTELEKVRNEAQKKLDEKSTFAEYVFKPMPDNKPELSERVTYFSKKDGDVFCQGLGLDGNPYEEKVLTDSQSSLKLDARLKFSNFQRDVLNELAAKGLVLYSVQQDWKFILENLCLALNLVKHSITDPKGSFHQELAKVGIFYENSEPENGKYVLKLSEAENFKTYKEYICDVDSQIAAAFDKKAAEARQTKLKKLHAKQFFFSPDSPTLLSTDKSGIFWGALKNVQTFHTLQPSWPKFSVEQSKLIEDDIKRVEEDLDGEDRAKLEKVRMDIEEAGKQQQVLFKAYEQQKKRVQELKVSDDILRQEDEILNKYEDSHEELADERGAVISKITSISEEKQQKIVKLGRLLEDVNDQNCKLNDVTQTISHEKATRYRIQKAIDTLISKHERFAVKPISLWIRISRSSRSIQLAKELSSIKNDLMNSSVKISEIRSKLVIALDSFKSNSNKNDDLVEFEEDLKLELVPECSSDAMYSLHQKQVGISFDQDTIISKILPVLNLEITNCHNELGALIARKSELEKEIRDLQSKVKAIRARRAEELVEKNNLQQVEKLKENSQQGQLIDAPNLKWLRILSEKNALPYNAHETVLTSSMDEKVEISREASLPIREETIHTPFEPRQDKEIVSENAVWDILTDLSPDQLTPIAELTKEETISGDSKKIKNRAKWAKIADPIIDPNTGMAPRYDHEANRHMGEIRKKHLEAVLEEAGSKGLKQFKPAPGDLEPDKPKAALLLSPVSGARIENRKKRADLRRKELLNQKTLPDSVKASGCRDSIFSHNDNKPKEANEALSLLDKVSLNLSSNLITHSH